MKTTIKFVIIVLCYRETEDIKKLLGNIQNKRNEIAVVIVNSYYDELTMISLQKTAKEYNCDFISIENKGYGYGNNRGIEYANIYYKYEYLGICNPDIEFIEFPLHIFSREYLDCIIAPRIYTNSRKAQNPYYYSHLSLVEWLKYVGFKKDISFVYFAGVAINKLYRISRLCMENVLNTKKTKIYACHGSCFFIGCKAMDKMELPYNEEMFLYHEEEFIARVAHSKKINTFFMKDIVIKHHEDGSSVEIKNNGLLPKYMKQSYLVYYNYWITKK